MLEYLSLKTTHKWLYVSCIANGNMKIDRGLYFINTISVPEVVGNNIK